MLAKAIGFDLDDTLTVSKTLIDNDMAVMLSKLLRKSHVLVISGASFKQFDKQLLAGLSSFRPEELERLCLLPACGGSLYLYNRSKGWEPVYEQALTDGEKKKINAAFQTVLSETPGAIPEKLYGDQLEDRKTQITFSALGQDAPLDEKRNWDADQKKRRIIQEKLSELLPEFTVKVAGTTSIDVTRGGIDKAFGISECLSYIGVSLEDTVYVGDALFKGGNDEPVLKLGIKAFQVSGPEETYALLSSWLDEEEMGSRPSSSPKIAIA